MDRWAKNWGLSIERWVWVDRWRGSGQIVACGHKKRAYCYALFSGAVRRVILPRAWRLCRCDGVEPRDGDEGRLFLLEERNDPEEEAGAYDCGKDLSKDGGAE